MPIAEAVQQSFRRSVALYAELVAELPEAGLALKLPEIPSNSIAEQLWCVVGARESFTRAIEAGAWSGFSCSLTRAALQEKAAVQAALDRSAQAMLALLPGIDAYGDDRSRLLVDLLEHEVAHQGQLIRYLCGLRLAIPAGWKAKYALS